MASTIFKDFSKPAIDAAWLNDVNALTYTIGNSNGASKVGSDDDGATLQQVADEAKPLANYNALRAYTGRALGVRITSQGIAGNFQRDPSDNTSLDNGGTIVVDASGRRWKRLFVGPVYIAWFNPSLSGDTYLACQGAIDFAATSQRNVMFDTRTYSTSLPLRLPNFVSLLGTSVSGTVIQKTTTTVDTLGSISSRGGAVFDDYNVDSVVSVIHAANDFARFNDIENLTISRTTVGTNSYGIFAPRISYANFRNLIIGNCTKAIFSYVAYTTRIQDINAIGVARALSIENDGTGLGGSTSLSIERVYANGNNSIVEPDVGTFLYGASYSGLTRCAVDNYIRSGATPTQTRAYWLSSCRGITLDSCGIENIKGELLRADSCFGIVVTGISATNIMGSVFGDTVGALVLNSSSVTMIGSQFGAITSPGNIFNLILQGGSNLVDINEAVPISGGNAFVGYGGGSSRAVLRNGSWTVSNADGTRRALYSGQVSVSHGDADFTILVSQPVGVDRWEAPLSANRTATLSTTGALNGDSRRILRTTSSTGAFSLNVGTGPLKALSTGQWCDVVFDGTAWILSAYGSL